MTKECPIGKEEIKECVWCKEGLRSKEEGIEDIHHSVFSILCPFKQAWIQIKKPSHSQC